MSASHPSTKLEPWVRRVGVIAFFVAMWAIMRYFDCPTTNINPTHETGFGAILEQLGIAITYPTYFADDWRAPLMGLLPVAMMYWPLLILVFRPWKDLPKGLRYLIAIYSLMVFLIVGLLFLHLHQNWHHFFSP